MAEHLCGVQGELVKICYYIEEINVAVKLLFEENVAEYLCADQ